MKTQPFNVRLVDTQDPEYLENNSNRKRKKTNQISQQKEYSKQEILSAYTQKLGNKIEKICMNYISKTYQISDRRIMRVAYPGRVSFKEIDGVITKDVCNFEIPTHFIEIKSSISEIKKTKQVNDNIEILKYSDFEVDYIFLKFHLSGIKENQEVICEPLNKYLDISALKESRIGKNNIILKSTHDGRDALKIEWDQKKINYTKNELKTIYQNYITHKNSLERDSL